MFEIAIKKNDKILLESLFSRMHSETSGVEALIGRFHGSSTHHPNMLFARLDEAELKLVGDFLTEALAVFGFGDDYELNELGSKIDKLVCIFNEPLLC